MSSDYTVYAKGDPEAIRKLVEGFLGLELRAPPGEGLRGVLHGELLEVPVTFEAAHGMIDDMGIAFSEYPVAIAFGRSGMQHDADLRESLCRAVASLLGRHLSRTAGVANIVVEDSQQVVEGNPARGEIRGV